MKAIGKYCTVFASSLRAQLQKTSKQTNNASIKCTTCFVAKRTCFPRALRGQSKHSPQQQF